MEQLMLQTEIAHAAATVVAAAQVPAEAAREHVEFRVQLREYQMQAVTEARAAIKAGKKNILICAPTGAGKTVIASYLIESSQRRGSRSAFVVDRTSLIQQTSDTFDRYGLDHGVMQADHWRWRPSLPTQLCSIQTIIRRRWPDADLIVIDEAHTVTEGVKKRIEPRNTISIGLTATPFTPGLGKLYDCIINVTTTSQLIADGFLVPYRIYSCAQPDMEGVRVVRGEWEEKEAASKALQVVGDVVQEYLTHGEGRKFICSAVNTAHVEELARQFLGAGINVATYTYKDRDEDRADTVAEFRKTDSAIRGLITVTAASKGFDVADIGCVIMARPLRKSLAEHIQFFGRGLRISPDTGKVDCLILDHSGNCARFWDQMNEFFDGGVSELDDGKKKEKPKVEKKPAEPMRCPNCRAMHKPSPVCPACGHEYPKRSSGIEHVPGSLKELVASGNRTAMTVAIWPQIVHYALQRKPDPEAARRMALALYRSITQDWPKADFHTTKPVSPSRELLGRIKSSQIAWSKAREKEQSA